MDGSSNLIQMLYIQFMPLKDTFSNPILKATIWMAPQSLVWCEWVQIERLLFSVFPPRLCDKAGLQVTDWAKVWDISGSHTCPHCHLSWEQPFKSVHFYILPLPQYSDQILTTVAYIILNWMKIEKQPSTRLVPPPAPALFMTFHKTHLRPDDDQLTFQPTNECPEKFSFEILRILF